MIPALEAPLAQLRGEPSRTWSIVMTVMGDAIVPRGGSVWLGVLLALFRALEVGEGAVRTALSRLAADGWVDRTRTGRHSFYRLTGKGEAATAAASALIYGAPDTNWDGRFHLLIDAAAGPPGFAALGPSVLVGTAPAATPGGIRLVATAEPAAARALAARAWRLDRVAEGYHRFLAAFAGLDGAAPDDAGAMLARTLLVHQFRRVVLRDPGLPAAILPPDWPGRPARALCGRSYRALLAGSERWLDAQGLAPPGPDAAAALHARFPSCYEKS